MNKKKWIQLAAILCAILFLMVGMSKLMGHSDFVKTLGESPVVGQFVGWLSYTLPIVEILAAMALLIPLYRRLGFIVVSILMIAFTIYNIYLLMFAPYVPCSCGGIFNKLSWTSHLVVNISFTILAISGWFLSKDYLIKYNKPNS